MADPWTLVPSSRRAHALSVARPDTSKGIVLKRTFQPSTFARSTFNIRQVDLQLTHQEKLELLALWKSEEGREVEEVLMDSEVDPQTIEKDFL
jgi:hypothetical protein